MQVARDAGPEMGDDDRALGSQRGSQVFPSPVTYAAAADANELVVNITIRETRLVIPRINLDVYTQSFCVTGACSSQFTAGPTIRIFPGQTLVINLHNALPTSVETSAGTVPLANTSAIHNSKKDVTLTGLHTHGLHVSSAPPGDSIFTVVHPGETKRYEYHIPGDHMPGTFWYHPHHHGSTAQQAGGGAAGLLLVEERSSSNLPREIAALDTADLVLLNLNAFVEARESKVYTQNCKCVVGSCDACAGRASWITPSQRSQCHRACANPLSWWQQFMDAGPGSAATLPQNRSSDICPLDDTLDAVCRNGEGGPAGRGLWRPLNRSRKNVVLVNGALQPKMAILANKWYRWRVLFSSSTMYLSAYLCRRSLLGCRLPGVGGSGCELRLLAKDGIFLPVAPRDFDVAYLPPGGRGEWVVRCRPGRYRLRSGRTIVNPVEVASVDLRNLVRTSVLDVVAVEGSEAPRELPTFQARRPCYLVDLRTATPSRTLPITLGPAPRVVGHTLPINAPPFYESPRGGHLSFNGSGTFDASVPVGEVVELRLSGVFWHAFHLHVNPFQIVGGLSGGGSRAYLQDGDWHDTIMTPSIFENNLTVRTQTDRFTGHQIFHCHLLLHEDQGMMGQLNISGTEGTIWKPARQVDPTCY